MTLEEIDAGYDFIRDCAPRGGDDNAVHRWVKKCQSDPQCKVYKFSKLEILDAIRNLRTQGEHASTQNKHGRVLVDVADWCRGIVYLVITYLNDHSLIMIGEEKKGKTAFASLRTLSACPWTSSRWTKLHSVWKTQRTAK